MIRNQSGQSIGAQMINATTGAAFVGTVTVLITIDAGVQTLGSVGAGVCTHEGNGYYTYLPSADETNGAKCDFTFIGTGAIPQTIQVPTVTAAQQSSAASATGSGAITVQTLVEEVLEELGIYSPGEAPSPEDAASVLRKLNRLLDNLNADSAGVYVDVFSTFTLVPSLAPHTIGPNSATFTLTQRPQSLSGANLILASGARTTIDVHGSAWWQDQAVPDLTTAYPTDVYYEPAWPNGNLYFWPVPTTAFQVELLTRAVLSQVVLTDTFWLPPGYRDMVTLTTAEECAASFKVPISPQTALSAQRARARVFANNLTIPALVTRDAGMPGGEPGRGYNYLAGRNF